MKKKDLKLGDKEVVHCPTEELANKVLQIAHECGYKWGSGVSFIYINNYDGFKSETCYNLNRGVFNFKSHFIDNNYTIVTAEEFLKRHGVNVNLTGELKAEVERLQEHLERKERELEKADAEVKLKTKYWSEAMVEKDNLTQQIERLNKIIDKLI